MKIPSEVFWQLTKKWNSKLVKFNGQQFTHDPFSLNNLHNASQTNSTVGLSADKIKGRKKEEVVAKRVVTIIKKNKSFYHKSAASSRFSLKMESTDLEKSSIILNSPINIKSSP